MYVTLEKIYIDTFNNLPFHSKFDVVPRDTLWSLDGHRRHICAQHLT